MTKYSKQSFKLLATDIDGTLFQAGGEVSRETRKAIEHVSRGGVKISLATGKQYSVIQKIASDLGLFGLHITSHGAAIFDHPKAEPVFEQKLDLKDVQDVIRMGKALGVTTILAGDGKTYVDQLNKNVEYMLTYGDPYPIVCTRLEDAAHYNPTHIMMICFNDQPLLERTLTALKLEFGKRITITLSSPYYIEITHKEVSKGTALRYVANYYGVKLDEVVSIGDGRNDIPMFRVSGFSIAMGNSDNYVKEAAHLVTDSVENDGLAKALFRVFA